MHRKARYALEVTPPAARSLKRLGNDQPLLRHLDEAIRDLPSEPRPSGCKKLVGKQFNNLYRIRVGDWRILYTIEDDRLVILVLDVIRRDQAYRGR